MVIFLENQLNIFFYQSEDLKFQKPRGSIDLFVSKNINKNNSINFNLIEFTDITF